MATMMGHICLHVYFQKRQLAGYNNLTYVKIAAQGLRKTPKTKGLIVHLMEFSFEHFKYCFLISSRVRIWQERQNRQNRRVTKCY
jgi:hypothetical protein